MEIFFVLMCSNYTECDLCSLIFNIHIEDKFPETVRDFLLTIQLAIDSIQISGSGAWAGIRDNWKIDTCHPPTIVFCILSLVHDSPVMRRRLF